MLAGVGGVTERALQPRGRPSRLISPEADPLCPWEPLPSASQEAPG